VEINNEIVVTEQKFKKDGSGDILFEKTIVAEITEYIEDNDNVEIMLSNNHYIRFRFGDLKRIIQ